MGTVTKALGLLLHFSADKPEIGLTELATMSQHDKGTVHRYLRELLTSGFVEQNPDTRSYRLGPAVMRLARIREQIFPLQKAVAPIVDDLSQQLGELVHAAVPQSNGLSPCYHKQSSTHRTRVVFDESDVLPLHATSSGIAYMAFGPKTVTQKVLKQKLKSYTAATPGDAVSVMAAIENARNKGFSHLDESYEAEVSSLAAPFYDHTGHVIGTIAVATPSSRMDEETRMQFAVALLKSCKILSQQLGADTAAISQQIEKLSHAA